MPFPTHRSELPTDSSIFLAQTGFKCTSKLDGSGVPELELVGELDLASCPRFAPRLAEAQRTSLAVTLDLRRLAFIDSAGYALLVEAARTSRPGAKIVLIGCGGQVKRLLDLVGLPEKIESDNSVPSGLPRPSAAGEADRGRVVGEAVT